MRHAPAFALAAIAATLAPSASATVVEPDGLTVPVDSNTGETQLHTFFQSRGESIDWKSDAHDSPATFSPLCGDFTAEYVLNQAGLQLGLAWYNANASSPPTGSDLHLVVPPGSQIGFELSGQSIKADPAYAGGEIGFALVGAQTHYSEYEWNPSCTSCSTPGPWKLVLIYASATTPNAYYLAFEDGNVTSSSSANDNDFNDHVFFLAGLAGCSGAGASCDTGRPGICGPGITQCTAGNAVECAGIQAPVQEKCNGLDDDCDGIADDGDICPPGEICDKGTCVHKCGGGEFGCPWGKVCDQSGYCVDADCRDVSCPSGQACVAGRCAAPCDGVACPPPMMCLAGQCVDPCAGVTCDAATVCFKGVCIPNCRCLTCPAGQACDGQSGLCMDDACANHPTCGAGTVCVGGSCEDPCAHATCPAGQLCAEGACIDAPDAGAAGGGIELSDGGFGGGAAGGGIELADGGFDGGAAGGVTSGDDGNTAASAAPREGASNGACGCRAVGAAPSELGWLGLTFGALVGARRRPRR